MGRLRRASVFLVPALAAAVVALSVSAAESSPSGKKLTTADVTRAYERWLYRRYPGPAGHWICPVGDQFASLRGGVLCAAEFFAPTKWHSLYTLAYISGNRVRFVAQPKQSLSWIRRWRTLPRHQLGGNGASGSAIVNAPLTAHDWSWLAASAAAQWSEKVKRQTQVNSDGPLAFDFEIFERFTCVVAGNLVTCTTPLGDSMRYRPR